MRLTERHAVATLRAAAKFGDSYMDAVDRIDENDDGGHYVKGCAPNEPGPDLYTRPTSSLVYVELEDELDPDDARELAYELLVLADLADGTVR